MRKLNRRILSVLPLSLIILALFVCHAAAFADEHSTVYNGVDYAPVYDYAFYTTSVHPELAGKSDREVLRYFVKEGIQKGDQANAVFSVKSYRNANQDLRKKYGTDYSDYIAHYLKTGYSQGRTCLGCDNVIKDPVDSYGGKSYNRVYDFNYYVSHNNYVRKNFALDDFGAIEYFVKTGMAKKHQANETFNVTWYYNKWAALRYNWSTNWPKYYEYYQKKGYRKGIPGPLNTLNNPIAFYKFRGKRYNLSKIYDFEYYTKHNSAAYKYWKNRDDAGAIRHFVNYGMLTGMQAKAGVTQSSAKYTSLRKKLHPNLNTNAYFKANDYSSRTKWLVLLNQGEYKVYIFKGQKGSWVCENIFPCTIGKPSTPTPTGVYSIGAKGLYFDSENCRCWYYTQMVGSIYFHSILYHQVSSPSSILDSRLSLPLSHGCIRLAIQNAKWIQDNIPYGTTVVSYNRPF